MRIKEILKMKVMKIKRLIMVIVRMVMIKIIMIMVIEYNDNKYNDNDNGYRVYKCDSDSGASEYINVIVGLVSITPGHVKLD